MNRFTVAVVAVAAALLLGWMLRGVLPIVAVALLYAVVTWPLVRRLERHSTRSVAIVGVDIGIAAVLTGAGFVGGPQLYAHAASLGAALPQTATSALAHLPAWMHDGAMTALKQVEAIPTSFELIRSASAAIAALVIIPVLAAYFQLDQHRYEAFLFDVLPETYHAPTRRALSAVAQVLGGFVRGQILVSAVVGLLVYAVLVSCGIPFAGSIALLTGVFDLVPYLGGIVAFVPSLLFAITAWGAGKALLVGLLLLGVFQLEAHVLAPQIVGSKTKLLPSTIVIVLLVGTLWFGVLGLYLAVPCTAAIVAAAREYISTYRITEQTRLIGARTGVTR